MTRAALLLAVVAAACSGGCAALTNPVADGIPVRRVPAEVLGRPKADLKPIPLTALRQPEPDEYRVDKGDVLAIIADEVIAPGNVQPPVRLPDSTNDTAAVGYPVPVGSDGTISLARLAPIPVKGKTVPEIEKLVRDTVTGKTGGLELVKPTARVSVQLLQKRRISITVVREDSQPFNQQNTAGQPVLGGTKKGNGVTLHLTAYENDVLHALNATGGPPGLDAKNEVLILRGKDDPADAAAKATRIPLRIYPDEPLPLAAADVILNEGDVLVVEARDTEVYYTAGLIGGGQYQLPRDYDLDVIQALAQVRAPLINGGFSQNAFVANSVNSGLGGPNPSLCVVLRKLPNGQQVPIRVDLNRAFKDTRERIRIRAGDVIVLQERPGEAITRYLTQAFRFTTIVQTLNAGSFTGTGTGNNP